MRFHALCAFVLFLFGHASLAYGQLDTNSMTVTASRTLSFPADQLAYRVSACGPLTSTLDEAVAQVRGLGLTAADFLTVGTSSFGFGSSLIFGSTQIGLCWAFNLVSPLARSKATLDALGAAVSAATKNDAGWNLSYYLTGAQSSAVSQASCPLTDLMADARVRAQKLASAAGLGLGAVLSVSGGTPSYSSCFLTVKFGITRF